MGIETQRELTAPSEWRVEPIGDHLEAVIDYRGKTPPKSPHGIPTLTAANIKKGRIDLGTVSYVSKETYERWTTRGFPEPRDVLITTEAPVGEVAPFPNDGTYLITRRVIALRGEPEELDNRFLLYALMSPLAQDYLESRGRGSTVPRVLKPDILEMCLPLPGIEEQRAIAHILGTLDDKIELNRQMNETLEEMARALFRSWFVDFDPVRAKIDRRWRPGASLPGLPAELYELFPDRLVESELGEVPEGWDFGTVSDLFDLTAGQSPPGSSYNETGVGEPFYQGRRDFGARFPDRRVFCTDPRRFAGAGDTLVSVRAPVGDVNQAWERCCIGRGLTAVRAKEPAASFTYYAMHELRDAFKIFEGSGSVFGSISKADFKALRHIHPGWNLVNTFENLVAPIDGRLKASWQESRTLSSLRDTLLPKLISGELRVPDAERIAARAE